MAAALPLGYRCCPPPPPRLLNRAGWGKGRRRPAEHEDLVPRHGTLARWAKGGFPQRTAHFGQRLGFMPHSQIQVQLPLALSGRRKLSLGNRVRDPAPGPSPQWARADSGSRSPRRRGSARVRETRPNAGLGLSARAGVHFPQWKHLENSKLGEKESGDARPRPGARRAPSPHPGAPRSPWLRGGRGPVGVAWGGGAERRAHFWAPTAVASAPRSGRGEGPPALPASPRSGLEVSGVSWSTAPPPRGPWPPCRRRSGEPHAGFPLGRVGAPAPARRRVTRSLSSRIGAASGRGSSTPRCSGLGGGIPRGSFECEPPPQEAKGQFPPRVSVRPALLGKQRTPGEAWFWG